MLRCNRCGLALTLFIDHLRRFSYWYCQICDTAHFDGPEAT
jgi:hypothetical protein